MGTAGSQVWANVTPVPKDAVKCLSGWTRSRLKESFELFKVNGSLTVTAGTFRRILKSPQVSQETFDIFRPKNGRIDFLTVFGPMVLMSDQHFISKVSFFFSIYDFNGNGGLNLAEFFISMRTMFKGIECLFDGATLPSAKMLEEA